MSQLIDNTAARLQSLPHLQEVPQSKLARMIVRTLIGALFVVIGTGLLLLQIKLIYDSKDLSKLSLWLLCGGIFMIILGASTWSTQIVITPLKVITSVLAELFGIVRGTK